MEECFGEIGEQTMQAMVSAELEVQNTLVPETQAMVNNVLDQILEAEKEIKDLENDAEKEFEGDYASQVNRLSKQLELKDRLLNIKESQIIDAEGRINGLQDTIDKKEKALTKGRVQKKKTSKLWTLSKLLKPPPPLGVVWTAKVWNL